MLDRYERLIEATRLAGREQEAFEPVFVRDRSYQTPRLDLGEYQRGYRILAAFSATGRPEDLGADDACGCPNVARCLDLALFASARTAWRRRGRSDRSTTGWTKSLGEPEVTIARAPELERVAFALGRLAESRALATQR